MDDVKFVHGQFLLHTAICEAQLFTPPVHSFQLASLFHRGYCAHFVGRIYPETMRMMIAGPPRAAHTTKSLFKSRGFGRPHPSRSSFSARTAQVRWPPPVQS